MWPPKRTASVTEWLEWLLSSLGRAGLEFDWNIGLDESAQGFDVKVRLKTPIPKEGWPQLKVIIPTYSLVCGWRVENLRHTNRTLTFSASNA